MQAVLKLSNRGIRVSIIVVMLMQVCALFAREYLRAHLNGTGYSELQSKHLSAIVGFAVLTVLMWPIVRETWPALRPLFSRPSHLWKFISFAILIAALLFTINKIGLMWVATLSWGNSVDNNDFAEPIFLIVCEDPKILLLAIPVTALLTPLFEETINRGLFLHSLLPKGRWVAILLSAALFTVLHIGATYPAAFLFGIVAAIQILAWRNIWGVIITHCTFNFLVQLDRVCLSESWIPGEISLAPGSPLQLSIAVLLLSVFGVYWLLNALTVQANQN